MSSLEAPMRLTRSRSRSQSRLTTTQPATSTSTSALLTSDRKRPSPDQQHNGYTAEEEDQASKFLKIDEEDEQLDEDVEMQPGSELGSKKRSRSRSKGNVDAAASKKQKEQPPSLPLVSAVRTPIIVLAPTQPLPPLTLTSVPSSTSTSTSLSASRPSLQPPSRGSSSGSSASQRSRSHSNARSTAATAYISPELLSGGGVTVLPTSSTSSTASLQPPATASAKRRPSVPNLPSQTRTSSSASPSATEVDSQASEFRMQLTLERLSQLRRQLDSAEGAAQLLELLQQVEGVAYQSGQQRAASVSRLSAVHNQLLSAMRQLAEQTAGTGASVSAATGRLLSDRIVPRSIASIVSSRSLLSLSLPSLITTNLPLSHKVLLLNPAAVHQKDADGFTALHYAVLNHDLPLIAYLCEHGANPAVLNNSRDSPLSLARVNSLDTSMLTKHPAAHCSRAEGGLTSSRQEFWSCLTCGLTGERGCCDVCSVRCHKGHVLQRVMAAEDMCNEGFCDCTDTGACQAADSTQSEQQSVSTMDAAAAVLSSEQDSIFSTVNGSVSASNGRSMLRLMEDVVVSSAELIAAASGGEDEEGEVAADEDESITWSDVWQATVLTTVLTVSFYAIFGGAEDIVNSATPAVHWLQQRWELLTAAVTAFAATNTKH